MADARVRARKAPIPVTIVAGLRGAGKTTLINRLLATPAFANTAVILNDFGEVALKNALVETAEDGFVALGSGCVCCAVRGALTDGLEKLLRDLDNGRVAAIGRVVIEADAAADPAGILGAIARHPYLALRFTADGIVAVLDASVADTTLAASADAVRQVAMADVIALTRADAADLRARLAALNPFAAIVGAGSAAPTAFTGHGDFDPATGDVDAWLGTMPAVDASLSGESNLHEAIPGEAGRMRAFAIRRDRSIPPAALDRFLDYLTTLQGPNLVRVRGLVAGGEGAAVIVDGIGGFFYPPVLLDEAAPGTRFSVVARDLNRETFAAYLDAFLNEARVDTPDRAALTDNPLAIAGFSARAGKG
jgi:G3E family GTPase